MRARPLGSILLVGALALGLAGCGGSDEKSHPSSSDGLPTIVTSNYRIGQIRDLWGGMAGKRVASRLAGACRAIEVKGQDRRLG